jgi:hypothetical protein
MNWENIIKASDEKLKEYADAAEKHEGEVFWLDNGLDIAFNEELDRANWSADIAFEEPIKFREEKDEDNEYATGETKWWAFIANDKKEVTPSSNRWLPTQDRTPNIQIDDEATGTRYEEFR